MQKFRRGDEECSVTPGWLRSQGGVENASLTTTSYVQ